MPPLSSTPRPLPRRAAGVLLAVAVLATLAALPRARAATSPSVPAAAPRAPVSAPATTSGKAPTCQAIMQRLSGSLAGTPGHADKPGTVLVDVDKAGVTMACSHSDAIAIPVPGNTKTR